MTVSRISVSRVRELCVTHRHHAHSSLDITQNRAVPSVSAAGTSWLEVNPAAVRTDGGPGSRLRDVSPAGHVFNRCIALELAILRGNDPDHPRSLSKVTRAT